ncbi:MAG: winged helix-turn-helix domain-containing protein [Candidatus Bathyarchaeia archaeon]
MRRSKLEIYEAILSALARRPMTIDGIAYRISMDCTLLQQYLESLVKYGLVREMVKGKRRVYAITERGLAVFRTLSFQRYLDKIAKSIKTASASSELTPVISKGEGDKPEGGHQT